MTSTALGRSAGTTDCTGSGVRRQGHEHLMGGVHAPTGRGITTCTVGASRSLTSAASGASVSASALRYAQPVTRVTTHL